MPTVTRDCDKSGGKPPHSEGVSFVTPDMKRLTISLLFAASAVHGAITGTVIDEAGKPVAGAMVREYAAEDSRNWHARVMRGEAATLVASAQSGDDGVFRIDAKAPLVMLMFEAAGKVTMSLEAADGVNLEAIVLAAGSPTKARLVAGGKPVANATVVSGPAVVHSAADGTVAVTGMSAVAHSDFVPSVVFVGRGPAVDTTLRPGVAIRGRVVDTEGQPVANATLTVAGWPQARSAADGTFTVAHAPVTWRSVIATDSTRAGIVTNSRARSYEIKLQPAASIAGTTVPAARISIISDADREDSSSVIADAQGNFTSPPLPPGRYTLRTFRRGTASATATVTLKPGEHITRSLPARPLAGIRGRIVDENQQPVAGAFVWSGSASFTPPSGLVITGQNGSFNAPRSEMDPAVIFAVKSGYAIGTSGPLTEGKNDITVPLPRGFPLQIRVIDRQRKNVEGANVAAQRGRMDEPAAVRYQAVCEEALSRTCRTTGSDGTVNLRVTEGTYEVRVSGPSIVTKTRPQTITAQSSPITIDVDRGVEVSGRVAFGDGSPVAGASVMTVPLSNATRSEDDGTFTLRNLPPGKISIVANSTDQQRGEPVEVIAPARNVSLTIPTPARIEGRVFDKSTNGPITDFQVEVSRRQGMGIVSSGGNSPSFHSDDGTFTLDPVTPGPIQLRVTAAGYAPGRLSDLTTEEGKTLRGIEVPLERGGQVRGRITARGDPVSGVFVRTDTEFTSTQSDNNGEYEIDSLAAGEQTLNFSRQGFLRQRKRADVARGKETRLDVEMDRGSELHGRVTDKAGHPVAGTRIMALLSTGQYGGQPPVHSEADGSFTLAGLAEGRYTISAQKEGYVTARVNDVNVPSEASLVLTLETGGTISGRVSGLSEAELSMTRVVATSGGGGTFSETTANADGTFVLNGVADGRMSVFASIRGASMRQSVPKVVDVVNGSAPNVDIDFQEGIKISGRVTQAGVPVQFGYVTFSGGGHPSRNGQISAEGRYEVNGLAAGNYDIRVFGNGIMFQGKYTVAGDSTYDIQIAGSPVRGRVVDGSTGAPISDARVWIAPSRDNPTPRQSMTDSEGHFVLDAVPDGTFEVHATSRQHYAPASRSVTISGGAPPDIELRLDPGQPTTFRVTGAQSGAPLDAFISINSGKTSIANVGGMRDEDGGIRAWLAPGQYKASIYMRGYVTQTVDFSAPGPDVRVALQQAGRVILIASKMMRIRLKSQPVNRDAMAGPNGITIDNLRPGAYTLEVFGDDARSVVKTMPVTVIGGQTVTVNID